MQKKINFLCFPSITLLTSFPLFSSSVSCRKNSYSYISSLYLLISQRDKRNRKNDFNQIKEKSVHDKKKKRIKSGTIGNVDCMKFNL